MGYLDDNSNSILLIVAIIIVVFVLIAIIRRQFDNDKDRNANSRKLLIGMVVVIVVGVLIFGYCQWKLPNGDGQRGEYGDGLSLKDRLNQKATNAKVKLQTWNANKQEAAYNAKLAKGIRNMS